MGTRALTVLQEPDGTELAVIYSQWDGYPAGLGKDLGKILGKYEVGNGIPGRKVFATPYANGISDLAMHLICELKQLEWKEKSRSAKIAGNQKHYPMPGSVYPKQIGHAPGGYYLYPAKTRDAGEEWLYFVGEREGKVWIRVAQAKDGQPDGVKLWEGWAKDLPKAAAKAEIWSRGT